MKTMNANNRHNGTNKKTADRRGRANPSRERLEPVAKWEASVHATLQGPGRADMKRKVRTRGVKTIDVLDLFEETLIYLRKGYEVRLTSQCDGEAIRLYPCLDADYKTMFVAAMTMGSFRQSIGDIPFRMEHCGETVDPTTECEAKQRKAETIRETRRNVTPDTVVTCPKCGNEFRVGKVLK